MSIALDVVKLAGYMLVSVCVVLVVNYSTAQAVADDYRFRMWVSPLECTRNEVSNGITVNIILTPKECHDLLHPVTAPATSPPGRSESSVRTPQAPDTGEYSDAKTTILIVSMLILSGAGVTKLIGIRLRQLAHRHLQK